jgi:hypothetical protein
MTKIKISSIQTDGLQARVSTDAGTVEEYAQAMASGKVFPPIVVYSDSHEHWLADGLHRLSAYIENGVEEVTVDLRDGTRDDALWHAVAANKNHGLKRTNADKRKAVKMALELHSEMSDRAIAEHVGVDHKTVAALRETTSGGEIPHLQVPANQGNGQKSTPKPPLPPPPKRVGLDGKSYAKPTPPAPKPKGPVDCIGREIPENVRPLWDQASALRVHIAAISRMRGEIRRAQEEQSAAFAEVQLNLVHAELNNLYTHMTVIEPYAVCPTCQGRITTGCRTCYARGYISEFRWKTAIPQQTKDIILATVEQ